MVTTAPVTPARTATPARWAAALSRAALHGITVSQDPRTGVFTAPSTDGTRRYRVGWYDCQCHAAQGGDPVCLHRAAFREHCREEDRRVARELRAAIDAEPPFPTDPTPAPDASQATRERIASLRAEADRSEADCRAGGLPYSRIAEANRVAADRLERELDRPVTPAPAPVAAVAAVVPAAVECRDCLGTGYERMYRSGRLNDWVAVTCGCQRIPTAA